MADLVTAIRARLGGDADLLMHIDMVVECTLGTDWDQIDEHRFDVAVARPELAFFKAEDIPRVSPAIPPEVSDVHFRSDLTRVPTMERDDWCRVGNLHRAIWPSGADILFRS